MVSDMDAETRNAAHAEAKAESLDALARLADLKVERRIHRDDGYSSDWARNMPKKPAPPTMAEVEAKIAELEQTFRELLAKQASDLQAVVASEIAEYHTSKQMRPVTSAVLQGIAEEILKRDAAEIDKLRSEHDLRLSALLHTVEKLERAGGDVVELPNPLRSRRA
jgi:hypothetical protein